CLIFFFQAEDGIRDFHVTGVQTCALPIYRFMLSLKKATYPIPKLPPMFSVLSSTGSFFISCIWRKSTRSTRYSNFMPADFSPFRSEERRVGKGCGSQRVRCHS